MLNPSTDLSKSPALIHCQDIAEICAPLFKNSIYYILNFIRLYNDGRALYLSDNAHWVKHYLSHGYPAIGAFEQTPNFRQKKAVIWDALNEHDPIVIYSRELFNIRFGITIIRQFSDGYDFFNFGTTQREVSVLEKLYTQQQELDIFIASFYDKMKSILKPKEEQLFYLPDFQVKTSEKAPIKLYLGPKYDYQYLTPKELFCVKHLIQGFSIPKVASLSHLSIRTVEKHVENIKRKLNCQSQLELGYVLAELGIKKDKNT